MATQERDPVIPRPGPPLPRDKKWGGGLTVQTTNEYTGRKWAENSHWGENVTILKLTFVNFMS